MRRFIVVGTVLAALAASVPAGAAAAEKPVKVRAGNLELTFNGGFKPKRLSKARFDPIALSISGRIRTLDGAHPPALREFTLFTDRNGTIDVRGYPTCRSGQLQARDTSSALRVCGRALIGRGKTHVQVQFAEQAPIPVRSDLLVLNGGTRGGTTTLFIHAYITVPTPAAIVTRVKIKKVRKGRYGIRSIATIPRIAGGAGSVTFFSLTVNKKFRRGGKRVSVLSARCRDRKLQAFGTARFEDGTRASAGVVRTCAQKR